MNNWMNFGLLLFIIWKIDNTFDIWTFKIIIITSIVLGVILEISYAINRWSYRVEEEKKDGE